MTFLSSDPPVSEVLTHGNMGRGGGGRGRGLPRVFRGSGRVLFYPVRNETWSLASGFDEEKGGL